MAVFNKRILILCKTYPSPSAKYSETSCVAGLDEDGALIRLYPIPFRLISDEQQFKKWQWVTAKVQKSRNDHRVESHQLFVDTLSCDGEQLSTGNNWQDRRHYLANIPIFTSFTDIEKARQASGVTLALLRPSRIVSLEIKKTENPEWTDEELEKLIRLQSQGDLFDQRERRYVTKLRKLPFDFYYHFECITCDGTELVRKKIVDWEIGALYWKLVKSHKDRWEAPFCDKLEKSLPTRDLMFLLGTIHRFPDQWLIISLIYPPKQQPSQAAQGLLFPE
jgi:hypothetical protein